MRVSYRVAAVLAAILLCTALFGMAKPNLTGTWKLNTSKSDFGQMPPPNSMTYTITHEEPNLGLATKQSSDRGEFEWQAKYTTDGKESKNTFRENPSTSIVNWDGDALSFDTKGKFGDNDFTMKDKWVVSDEGKVLTIQRHFASSFGEGDQKLVFEKQ